MKDAGMAEPESTKQSGTGDGDRFSQLIREEVRAAVYEFVPQADEPPSYDHPTIELEDISNSTAIGTEPPLDDAPAAEDGPLLGLIDDDAAESQDVNRTSPPRRGLPCRMPPWLKVVVALAPLAAVFAMMPLLSISGADLLFINVVAFFLVLVFYGVTVLFVVSPIQA